MTGWPDSSTSPRSPPTNRRPPRACRTSSPPPRSSSTSRSRTAASGCSRRAPGNSRATCPNRSRSWSGRLRWYRTRTCSTKSSPVPPGARSRAGTSWPTTTTPSIPTWSGSSPSGWAPAPTTWTAATSPCCPSRTSSSTSSGPPRTRSESAGDVGAGWRVGLGRLSADEVFPADLERSPAPVEVGGPARRAFQALAPVAVSRPDRVRARQAQRPDHPDRWQEEPEQRRPVLAFQDADEGEHAVGAEDPGGGQAQGQLDTVDVSDAERAEPDQGQAKAGGRQAHRLDRQLALAAPVDVLQMQDQGELIQDERGTGTDRDRGERPPAQRVRAADRGEGSDDEQDDARYRVMNVGPAGRHLVPERAAAVADQPGDRPGQHERYDESQKAQHEGQLSARQHVAVPP